MGLDRYAYRGELYCSEACREATKLVDTDASTQWDLDHNSPALSRLAPALLLDLDQAWG